MITMRGAVCAWMGLVQVLASPWVGQAHGWRRPPSSLRRLRQVTNDARFQIIAGNSC